MSRLDGKVALITGAARGIGRGCALELARRGADIVVNDFANVEQAQATAEEIRSLGGRALTIPGDVSDRKAMEETVRRAVAEFGRLDILIANAARNIRKPFLEMEEQDMADTLAVTLWGAFHVSQFAARQMVRQGHGGSIVFISSVHAVLPTPNNLAYNTAKSGLNHMARTMAAELVSHAVRVNIIEPGWIDTPGERRYKTEEELQNAGKALPMGRLGCIQDIARGAGYLCSDDAAYVTGTMLRIDGGYVLPRIS
jgi:glucose 1-dehydrogenase